MKLKTYIHLAAALLLGSVGSHALAQTNHYPDKAIKIIVPYAAGGTVDAVARHVGNAVSKEWGQPIVVENRPGAAGAIARSELSRASGDGYTLLADALGTLVASSLAQKKRFEVGRDFEPVATLAQQPFFLAVRSGLPINDVSQLIAYAKAKPGSLSFGSPGKGTEAHLVVELLKQEAKIDMVHVPYRGGTPAVTDLSAGTIDLVAFTLSTLRPALERKDARIIATLNTKRVVSMPNIPTLAEAGYPTATHTPMMALFASPGTPPQIISKWNETLEKIKSDQALVNWASTTASEVYISNAKSLDGHFHENVKKWTPVIDKVDLRD